MNYPEHTIAELTKYITNFDQDIEEIKAIECKIDSWVKRGVDIHNALNPINEQIQRWENKMLGLVNKFKTNITTLQKVDDRIKSETSLDLSKADKLDSNLEKWNYLFNQYKCVLENLKQDTKTLYEVEDQINKYKKLGVELGDAVQKIKNQNQNIINSIQNSMLELKELIQEIKVESNKIVNNETDKSEPVDNYWAFYDKINVDSESFSMYLNSNYWNSENDGLQIISHTDLNYINRRSKIYNSSVGEVQVHAEPEKPIKYIYYGYEKENLIKLKVRETNWGSYYVDSGNCMIQVYFGSTQVMENGKKSREYFGELYTQRNQEKYQNGAKTKDKWYLVASCEELENLSNINFRGENI
tara:strand:+ start:138 stop:1208 length:1071 start_codon:yes stop_codon:yes gene_type:complete